MPSIRMTQISAFCLFLLFITFDSAASDTLKERRWASQVENDLVVGDSLYLKTGEREFLSIYTPARGVKQKGGIILLHGMGVHPDWSDVISPLRQELPESGWATLSLQMPILPNEAKSEEYIPLQPEANERISAGILYLQQQGFRNIAIVGHSLGSTMGLNFLAAQAPGSELVRAYVGIGISRDTDGSPGAPSLLSSVNMPILDIYGSQDLRNVLNGAQQRKNAAKRIKNTFYRQVKVPAADHFFRSLESSLIKQVSSWLSRIAPSAQVKKAAKP